MNAVEPKPIIQPDVTRILSSVTQGNWISLDDVDDDGTKKLGYKKQAQATLIDCLTATNLIILSGLGTSLCVANAGGEHLAPTMWNLWEAVSEKYGEEMTTVQGLVNYHPIKDEENIETFLSKCKTALEFWLPDHAEVKRVEKFVSDAEAVILGKCSFVSPTLDLPYHKDFLRKVARRSARKPRTKLFTTNYDLCFETAASALRFVVVDGFSHTIPQTYDPIFYNYDIVRREQSGESPDFIEGVFQLFKLHGSVDWTKSNGEILRIGETREPLLIYPRSSKYQQAFEPPYIDMMSAFQSSIRQNEVAVIVIGFGFNDDHISEPILSALQANMNMKLVIVDPKLFDRKVEGHSSPTVEPDHKYRRVIHSLVQNGDNRISLLNLKFEEFVDLLPDLAADTERERHAERFRKIKEYNEGLNA